MQGTEACQFLKNHPWVSNVVASEKDAGGQRYLANISPAGHRVIVEAGLPGFLESLLAAPNGGAGHIVEFRHLQDAVLEAHFGDGEDNRPGILSWLPEPRRHRLLLDVNEKTIYFQGHFPDNPVFPGVAQLHWAAVLAANLFEFDTAPREVKRLKFMQVIRPCSVLELSLENRTGDEVEFRFAGSGQLHSTGCLCFKRDEPC